MESGGDVVRDLSIGWRGKSGQPVQMIAFRVREMQGAGECGDHLRRRGRRPSLLQPYDVVDRDPGKLSKLLPAQSSRSAPVRARQPCCGRGEAVAPSSQSCPKLCRVRSHEADCPTSVT